MIPISEIFYTLQGEGRYAGYPAIFIRTGGCNLRCPGFGEHGCDSSFSVDPTYRKRWKTYDSNELIKAIVKKLPTYEASMVKPLIVFTGGEPTLYIAQLVPTVTYFVTRGYQVQFETNATQTIDFEKFPIYKKVSFAMSVKLSCSGEPEHKRLNLLAINDILSFTENSFFKFVCGKIEDVREAAELLKEVPYYADVYLMPLGENKEELEKSSKLVFEACKDLGFKYSDRQHLRIYDDERGR